MEIKTEDFVKYCLNRKRCSIISQFRICILLLHIETGRFRNVKEDERKCHVCNNDTIENEFPFYVFVMHILNFDMYFITISIIFTIMFYNMTDKNKFVYLMEVHWIEVSIYLEKAWEKRSNNLCKQTQIKMLNVPGWLTMTRNEYMY